MLRVGCTVNIPTAVLEHFGRVYRRLRDSRTELQAMAITPFSPCQKHASISTSLLLSVHVETHSRIKRLKCCTQPQHTQRLSQTHMILKSLFANLTCHVSAWLAVIRANNGCQVSSQGTFLHEPPAPPLHPSFSVFRPSIAECLAAESTPAHYTTVDSYNLFTQYGFHPQPSLSFFMENIARSYAHTHRPSPRPPYTSTSSNRKIVGSVRQRLSVSLTKKRAAHSSGLSSF